MPLVKTLSYTQTKGINFTPERGRLTRRRNRGSGVNRKDVPVHGIKPYMRVEV